MMGGYPNMGTFPQHAPAASVWRAPAAPQTQAPVYWKASMQPRPPLSFQPPQQPEPTPGAAPSVAGQMRAPEVVSSDSGPADLAAALRSHLANPSAAPSVE